MKKTALVDEYELPLEVKKEKKWFISTCPRWPDCYAQAESADEVVSEAIAVAQTLIEVYREKGLKIPLNLVKKTDFSKAFTLRTPLIVPSM